MKETNLFILTYSQSNNHRGALEYCAMCSIKAPFYLYGGENMKHLNDSITVLSNVGPKRASGLKALGIETIEDLLSYYPFRYDDIQERSLLDIQDQQKVVLKGIVVSPAVTSHYGYKKSRLNFKMKIDEAVIAVTFFNQTFLKDKIQMDEEIAILGKWNAKRRALTGMKIMATVKQTDDQYQPVYHVNKQIKQSLLVQLIKEAFENYGDEIPEILPFDLRQRYRLMDRKQAMYQMHFPSSEEFRKQARRRLAYEELLLFELKVQGMKYIGHQKIGESLLYDNQKLKGFISKLPFELTNAQKKVTNEICRDLRSPHPMNRLLQGDVGSGKTVVAAIALVATYLARRQGALMVPTEILAEQHYKSLQELFQSTSIQVALLTGSTSRKERQIILEQLKLGTIHVVVGTHALIQEDVEYHNLGFAIIDEQHRFGVNQRQALREKGNEVDVLSMTATPIPRTLAITAYGEMDVSQIDELPKGRKPIQTRWLRLNQFKQALQFCKREIEQGSQMYVICPLIEESEALDARNAEEIYRYLCSYYSDENVGLLHGKMPSNEKEEIMKRFADNEIQILVSTTVVEVGVNVPNATLMMIMNADRFGLAQLHQLRGRVGRGQKASSCLLLADPKTDIGKERMKIMEETQDGFLLSQRDLEMRGPGEFFGKRQSGLPQFKIADLVQDAPILNVAMNDAMKLWENGWRDLDEYQALKEYVDHHSVTVFD